MKLSKREAQALAFANGDYRMYYLRLAELKGIDCIKVNDTTGAMGILPKEKEMFPALAGMSYVTFTRISAREIRDVRAYNGNMHSMTAPHRLH